MDERSSHALKSYRDKRNFDATPEPAAGGVPNEAALAFVIQKHWATRLHYDFRLELEGTMKSWAVPKGPSFDPADKRMAMHVEDHPISYNRFEGTIPPGNYGAGKVIIWDKGVWTQGLPRRQAEIRAAGPQDARALDARPDEGPGRRQAGPLAPDQGEGRVPAARFRVQRGR
jgi:DNA ligase D-like protein (predicted 3'-phosphoesterase)